MNHILILEIIPELDNQFARIGVADFGEYRYVVRSGRRIVVEGTVHNPKRSHFSLLLSRISEDAKQREFQRITNS